MHFALPRKNPSSFIHLLTIFFLLSISSQILSCSFESSSDIQALVAQWRLDEAQKLLERILEENPGDISARRLYARVLLARGELVQAREHYQALVAIDSSHAHSHRVHLGFALFYLGKLDSAEAVGREALALNSGQHDAVIVARCYNLLGLIDFNRGKYDRAFERQSRSQQAATEASSPQDEANALRQLGVLVWYRGNVDSALYHYYLPALELYRRVNDMQGEATTLSNISLLYNDKAERLTALRYQLEAFRIRKQIGDQRGLADSYYFLTATGTRGKTFGFLYTYRMKSLDLSRKIGYTWGEEVAARSLEELVPSTFLPPRPVESVGDTGTAEHRLYAVWRRALISFGQQQWESSILSFREILLLSDSLGYMQGRHVALIMYARALSGLNRFGEAERLLHQALEHNARVSNKDNEFIDLELARTSLRLGKTKNATTRLRSITESLDSLYLHHVRNPGMVFSLERGTEMVYEARSSAYRLLVETEVQNPEEVFQLMERERALLFWGKREGMEDETDQERDAVSMYVRLLEQYEENPGNLDDKALLDARVTELQEAAIVEQRILTEAGDRVRERPITSLPNLRRALEDREAFLEYFLAEEKVVVLVSRKTGSMFFTLECTPDDLTSSVTVLRDLILRGKDEPGNTLWKSPASFLFRKLIAPLERGGMIVPGDNLIISPHRILHLLPFQVLLREKDFLAQSYTVCSVPSATWFVGMRGRSPAALRSLLAAAPMGRALPFAEREVRRIPSEGFSNVRILRSTEATVGEIVRLFPQFDVVHLATHARMNFRYPLYSFIECSDDRLELHELFNHAGPERLVILSACESGMSGGIHDRKYTSEDIVSFPRAFVQGGVPSVIASLWLVEDKSAAAIFEEFYTVITASRDTVTLAEALTFAQRRFLANSKEKGYNSHPFYWASFYLFGDNR